jgi:hypothetical protein
VLAKEGVPTFRMQASPKVCEPQDLVAVFPWALSNATSGSPRLFFPFVQSARYVAEYRNWHWQHERRKKGSGGINFSAAANAYPSKSEKIDDEAVDDKGDNFGRIARTGLMDAFVTEVADERLLGVAVDSWQKCLNIQKAGRDPTIIAAKVEGFAKKLRKPISDEEVVELGDLLVRLAEIFRK